MAACNSPFRKYEQFAEIIVEPEDRQPRSTSSGGLYRLYQALGWDCWFKRLYLVGAKSAVSAQVLCIGIRGFLDQSYLLSLQLVIHNEFSLLLQELAEEFYITPYILCQVLQICEVSLLTRLQRIDKTTHLFSQLPYICPPYQSQQHVSITSRNSKKGQKR